MVCTTEPASPQVFQTCLRRRLLSVVIFYTLAFIFALIPLSWMLTVLTTKIRPSKPRVREEYTTSFMHMFYTNKVPRVVLQFLWTGTHLGGKGTNVPHELGTAAPPSMVGPAGVAGPARCGRTCPMLRPRSQSSPSPREQLG
jgi:hypothetical protein